MILEAMESESALIQKGSDLCLKEAWTYPKTRPHAGKYVGRYQLPGQQSGNVYQSMKNVHILQPDNLMPQNLSQGNNGCPKRFAYKNVYIF